MGWSIPITQNKTLPSTQTSIHLSCYVPVFIQLFVPKHLLSQLILCLHQQCQTETQYFWLGFFTVCNFCCQSKPNITSKRLISWLPQTEKNSLYTSILISFQVFIKQFDKNQSIHHHIQLLPQWVQCHLNQTFLRRHLTIPPTCWGRSTDCMVQYNLIQSNHSSYGIGACTVKHMHTISVHLAGM